MKTISTALVVLLVSASAFASNSVSRNSIVKDAKDVISISNSVNKDEKNPAIRCMNASSIYAIAAFTELAIQDTDNSDLKLEEIGLTKESFESIKAEMAACAK